MENNPVEAASQDGWPLPVVVLGGGLGTRLRPFTRSMPKPLVEVNGRPMIDRVIDGFRALGCDDFVVTTGYRADQLRRHFEACHEGMRVRFVDNGELDGNAIWWRTLKGTMQKPFVLTCCDVLVDVDYPAVAREHALRGDAMTLVAYRRKRIIPGGAVQVGPDGAFEGFLPRRTIDEVVYAGVAVVEPAVFCLESGGDNPLTLQNLLESCHEAGWHVGVHVVEGTSFRDMGSICALVRTVRALRKAEGDARGRGGSGSWAGDPAVAPWHRGADGGEGQVR